MDDFLTEYVKKLMNRSEEEWLEDIERIWRINRGLEKPKIPEIPELPEEYKGNGEFDKLLREFIKKNLICAV